jgi:hypothetical protein
VQPRQNPPKSARQPFSPFSKIKSGCELHPQKTKKEKIQMIRFIFTVVSFCLMIGIGEVLVKMTYRMATRAEHAFLHDQISYEKFTKAMIEAKPRVHRQNKL